MKKIIKYLIFSVLVVIILVLTINLYIILVTKSKIKTIDKINDKDIDCIIVLGAGIRGDNPSPMLEDRLLTSVDLYIQNISNKIIVSGDHGQINYDEVNVMKNYLIEKDIPSENIFMDHAGFSTYDSIYRAKEIFKAKKVVIITQKYHLYRALYIAKELDLESYGVIANKRPYANQLIRDIREIAARIKDFIKCIFKPKAKYLGETISVSGNGDITNDK
ncbi:MAG: YdcF family protein [Bacilli bacterium]|nr:YdcF family protein [Bacilli bacterium]